MQIPTVQPTSHHLSECQEQGIVIGCGKWLCRQKPDWGFSSRVTFEINQIVKMINLPKPPLCVVLAVQVVLPQRWGLLWFPVRVRRGEYIWIIGGWFCLFFQECMCMQCLHLPTSDFGKYCYLYLIISFTMMLLVEIPSQLQCICGTEENAGSSVGCTLWWNGIFGRFQRFSGIGTMFWIRHHPSVSLFRTVNGPLDSFSAYAHVEAVHTWAQDTWGFGRWLEMTVFPPFFLEISPWVIF